MHLPSATAAISPMHAAPGIADGNAEPLHEPVLLRRGWRAFAWHVWPASRRHATVRAATLERNSSLRVHVSMVDDTTYFLLCLTAGTFQATIASQPSSARSSFSTWPRRHRTRSAAIPSPIARTILSSCARARTFTLQATSLVSNRRSWKDLQGSAFVASWFPTSKLPIPVW